MMALSPPCKAVSAITLLAVPTIMYGGLIMLGLVTEAAAGLVPEGLSLDAEQRALWRAGHAHAGVWVILSLVLQLLLDGARLGKPLEWIARTGAPVAAVVFSGGFFGLAFAPAFRLLLYGGALLLAISLVLTAVGLLRNLRSP